MTGPSYKNQKVLELLGLIYQEEMSGITRYLHYSFMIMGHNRIPIQKWFRDNATESMGHAILIGEKITSLGGHPPMVSSKAEETNIHTVHQLLEESLSFEIKTLGLYEKLTHLASELGDIALEELARTQVKLEVEHSDEVRKMLIKPESTV